MNGKKIFLVLACLIYLSGTSQNLWNTNAKFFISHSSSLKLSKLKSGALDTLITNAGSFITSAEDSADKKTLSELYGARAKFQLELVQRKYNGNATILPDDDLFYKTEADFLKAMDLCGTCRCSNLYWLKILYFYEEDFNKAGELDKEIKSLGGTGEWTSYLGISLNYIAPANIVGAELCVLLGNRPFPTKIKDPQTGKKYRACEYEYPMAVGLFSIGFEKSLNNSDYNAFKVNPFWIDGLLSLHPAQFLYAINKDSRSVIWRPEIGFSYSSLSINYGYNLSFKKSFDAVPNHLLSLKIALPVWKPRTWN